MTLRALTSIGVRRLAGTQAAEVSPLERENPGGKTWLESQRAALSARKIPRPPGPRRAPGRRWPSPVGARRTVHSERALPEPSSAKVP